jgi:hypothetical protein
VAFWYADGMPVRKELFRISFLVCIPDGHLQRVAYTRRCIDTIDFPYDEHEVARNMERIEINI